MAKMGRPSKGVDVQVAFRLPQDLSDRLDEYVKHMAKLEPWPVPTRSDAVRVLLRRALDEAEAEREEKPKRGRS